MGEPKTALNRMDGFSKQDIKRDDIMDVREDNINTSFSFPLSLRSTRPSAGLVLRAAKSGGDLKIGDKYQATLPALLEPSQRRIADLKIESKPVWQPHRLEKREIEQYLESCTDVYMKYFGLNMPPKVREAAFFCLDKHNYKVDGALIEFRRTVEALSKKIAGITGSVPFTFRANADNELEYVGLTREEEEAFVGAMLFVGRDLRAIATRIPSTSPGLIVRYYYEHYKQVSYLRANKQRIFRLVEHGNEPTNTQPMDPKRMIAALRVLALSNHDSFMVDQRVTSAVTYFRDRRQWKRLYQRAADN